MQDKAIAAIGEWQLEKSKDIEPVDLYIENMFPGKDYQILLLIFKINKENDTQICTYDRIDVDKISTAKEGYKKYAYPVDKKIKTIKETTFKNILALESKFLDEAFVFKTIKQCFQENEDRITAT